ncbi:histidinol-phosphatase HisJ family protein [Candidatus Dependentiae bacterium]|nr:histidinol-phosphatase HisJ family protein [Candidatus Dependentiae bacterium]
MWQKIKILKGLEAGFQPHITEELSKNINSFAFDFVINSVHVIDKIHAGEDEYFSSKTQHKAYKIYLEEVYVSVCKFKNYDVIGHIGFVRRYGNFLDRSMKFSEYKEVLDEILKQVVKDDKGIEINSSGYRGVLKTPIPDYDIVNRYIQLGGEIITLGSDSHVTGTNASNFNFVKEKLKDLNFKYTAYFENRKPKFIKLK